MQAGDANVEEAQHAVAHDFGGSGGLFGDGNVAGAGRDDADDSLTRLKLFLAQGQGAGEFPVDGGRVLRLHGLGLLQGDAGGQHVVAALGQAVKDFGQMLGGFAGTKDHLRHAHAVGTVMIHLGKAEVLKKQVAQLQGGLVRRELSAAYLLQKRLQTVCIHGISLPPAACRLRGKALGCGDAAPRQLRTITLAVTGASGSVFARHMLRALEEDDVWAASTWW